ncbi:tetratricopeptide repeat protein 8 isoform X3 [Dermacentor andersoni]|uniref:tetratricopeptide repeat protein 8 isoform X3 n=1 Tax=Dermacentor andersoni TaxID=34620 RepID=UPI0024172B27|nr:tetratricopeptide repeat protein 8-like isoform X3 [Dermacentor andersoni]
MTDNSGTAADLEPVQQALSLYRRRHFTECAELCERHASKQLQWLGMLALTQHAWLDELELEGLQSLAEELLDDQATAQTGRPGTSLRAPPPPTGGGRPMTREGRPLTGIRRRPQTRTAATRHGVERALTTAAGRTARPTTAAPAMVQELAEFGRLGAASSGWPDKPWLSKPLFRFLYHQRGDVRQVQLQMDQPLAAVEAYRRGLDKFPNEAALVAPMARVYEGLHDLQRSAKLYRELLSQDAVHVEAIACVATHHFYADQPEMALRFYRRLLQLGMPTAELYNNLALCCFYAQQYDMALTCFDRALALAEDQLLADVWYNLGLVALSSGDKTLATRAFRLALVYDNCHAESYNNLGVLELTSGNVDQAASYFVTASEMAPELCEAQYNRALVLEQMGDLQGSARAASKCSQHASSADLLQKVQAFFQSH